MVPGALLVEGCPGDELASFISAEVGGAAREIDRVNLAPDSVIEGLRKLGAFSIGRLDCLMSTVRFTARYSRGVAHVILVHGSAYLMLGGEGVIAVSFTEPGGGTDMRRNLKTRAEPSGGSYRVYGEKVFTSNALYADRFLVLALDEEGAPALFECPRSGAVRVEPLDLGGFRGSGVARVFYEGDECRRVTERGVDGVRVALRSINVGRLGYAAIALGMADRALEIAVDVASRKVVLGRPLIEYQGLRWMLAEVKMLADAVESLVAEAVREAGDDPLSVDPLRAAEAKVLGAELARRASWLAVQVMGGRGLEMWGEAERMHRDARVLDIGEGAREVLLDFIASRVVKSLAKT